MNTNFKKLLLLMFVLYFWPAFSKEKEASATEAGAICLSQNCPSTEGSLQTLQKITSAQLCEAMKKKPECKGIAKEEEKLIKGCQTPLPPSSDMIDTTELIGEGVLQCGFGMLKGVGDTFVTLYEWITGMLPDDGDSSLEDPGLKAYLHAEFEDASQDSGTVMAALETTGSIAELLYDSMADVYSCLNPMGVTKKICQLITSMPITGIVGGSTGLVVSIGVTAAPQLIPVAAGIAAGYQVYKNTDNMSLATIPIIIGAVASTGMHRHQLMNKKPMGKLAGRAITATILTGAALGMSAGSMATHDKVVTKRIKERIKNRVQEFKEKEESKPPQE